MNVRTPAASLVASIATLPALGLVLVLAVSCRVDGPANQCPTAIPPAEPPAAPTAETSSTAAAQELSPIEQVIDMMERRHLGIAAVSRKDGQLLRMLVRAIDAKHVVEVGTSTGYSGLWLLAGLEETDGKLTTFELEPTVANTAKQHFSAAGAEQRVRMIVGDAHVEVAKVEASIDLLFLDADKKGYLDYLQKLLPLVREGGLVVAHNMVYPSPDPRYIEAITTDPALHTLFLNMDGPGMAVSQKRSSDKPKKPAAKKR